MIRFTFTDMKPIENKFVEQGLSFASGYDQTRKKWVAFVGFDNPMEIYEATGDSKLEAFIQAAHKFWDADLTRYPSACTVKR